MKLPRCTGVADAMRRSWTRPLSTIGSSVNLDPALQDRQSRDPKPGLGLYALRALALALTENPAAAAKFIGNRVVQSNSIDVGIAVEAEDGIMVPVIRSADETSLADLTAKYKELVELARQRRISPRYASRRRRHGFQLRDLRNGMGHADFPCPIKRYSSVSAPAKEFLRGMNPKTSSFPKTEAQITLSFDHRSIDGGGASRLLKRVIELLQQPTQL